MAFILPAVLLSVLVAIVSLHHDPEPEDGFWGKMALYYFSCIFSLNLGPLRIPVLIIIGYARLQGDKPRLNRPSKGLALIFALITFIAVHYIMPTLTYRGF